MKVCVYKNYIKLGEGLTDVDGHFEVLINNSNTSDISIKIVFDDDIMCIKDLTAVALQLLNSYGGSTIEYNSPSKDLQSGSSTIDFGDLTGSTSKMAGVLNIWRYTKLSHDFYQNNSNGPYKNLPKIKIYWNSDNLGGTQGSTELPILYIGQNDAYDKFTIVHEYGHYIMQCNGVYHMNLWEYLTSPDGLVHYYNEPVVLSKYAYSEGWAGFFACAVLNTNTDYKANFINATYDGVQLPLDHYYEVNDASVLLNLYYKTGSFSKIDDIMRRDNIDIYSYFDKWFLSGYADGIEQACWNFFDNRGCSNDQTIPTACISIVSNSNLYTYTGKESSDNVIIVKYEWLVDGHIVYTGYGQPNEYTVDVSGFQSGWHTLTLRCYDPEGVKTNDSIIKRFNNPYGEKDLTDIYID